jgi:hypothetical protein
MSGGTPTQTTHRRPGAVCHRGLPGTKQSLLVAARMRRLAQLRSASKMSGVESVMALVRYGTESEIVGDLSPPLPARSGDVAA